MKQHEDRFDVLDRLCQRIHRGSDSPAPVAGPEIRRPNFKRNTPRAPTAAGLFWRGRWSAWSRAKSWSSRGSIDRRYRCLLESNASRGWAPSSAQYTTRSASAKRVASASVRIKRRAGGNLGLRARDPETRCSRYGPCGWTAGWSG